MMNIGFAAGRKTLISVPVHGGHVITFVGWSGKNTGISRFLVAGLTSS
jgi:hypothetical protein